MKSRCANGGKGKQGENDQNYSDSRAATRHSDSLPRDTHDTLLRPQDYHETESLSTLLRADQQEK